VPPFAAMAASHLVEPLQTRTELERHRVSGIYSNQLDDAVGGFVEWVELRKLPVGKVHRAACFPKTADMLWSCAILIRLGLSGMCRPNEIIALLVSDLSFSSRTGRMGIGEVVERLCPRSHDQLDLELPGQYVDIEAREECVRRPAAASQCTLAAMARALSPAPFPWDDAHIVGIIGVAGPVAQFLGAKTYQGNSYLDMVSRDPQLLRRWANAKGQLPHAREQKAFAKIMLSMLEASLVIDVGSVVEQAPRNDSRQRTVAGDLPLNFTEPRTVARTSRRGVLALPSSSPIVTRVTQAASATVLRWWQFAPCVVSFLWFAVAWLVLSRPEVVAIVPLKIASFVPMYLAWAGNRIIMRFENELALFLGIAPSLSHPLASESTTMPGASGYPTVAGPVPAHSASFLGWLAAAYMAWQSS
jgi:hypothetical protein